MLLRACAAAIFMVAVLLFALAGLSHAKAAGLSRRHHHAHHLHGRAHRAVLRPRGVRHVRRHPYSHPVSLRPPALAGRPAGCPPRNWCGCFMAHLLGMPQRALWLAANWARVGRPAHGPQVGAVVVWRHHVGKVMAVAPGRIRVLSGNDGRAVRDRWRSTRGVIAYRLISQR